MMQIVLMLISVLCSVFIVVLSYEILSKLFTCQGSSTLLLKGSKASFSNICASIRHLFEWYRSHLFNIQRVANV
jgi:hypothetical protein